jgi:hypothetical protein
MSRPPAFFLSVVSPESTEAKDLIYLAYPGAVSLGAAIMTLGIGLIRAARSK